MEGPGDRVTYDTYQETNVYSERYMFKHIKILSVHITKIMAIVVFFIKLESMACYAGLLLALAEGFDRGLFCIPFRQKESFHAIFAHFR